MCAVLQALFCWQYILFGVAVMVVIFGISFLVRKYTTILGGSLQLLQSPSGVFGLLTLVAITLVTWFQPSVGGTAFAAFVGIVPAILAYCEHREQTQMNAINASIPSAPPESNSAKPVVGSPDAPVA